MSNQDLKVETRVYSEPKFHFGLSLSRSDINLVDIVVMA